MVHSKTGGKSAVGSFKKVIVCDDDDESRVHLREREQEREWGSGLANINLEHMAAKTRSTVLPGQQSLGSDSVTHANDAMAKGHVWRDAQPSRIPPTVT